MQFSSPFFFFFVFLPAVFRAILWQYNKTVANIDALTSFAYSKKGKGHLVIGHEGTEGKYYSRIHF